MVSAPRIRSGRGLNCHVTTIDRMGLTMVRIRQHRTLLVHLLSDLQSAMDVGHVSLALFDVSSAFDSVDHSCILLQVFLHLLVWLVNHLSGFAPFSLSAQTVLHLALLGQPGSMPLLVSPGLNSWTTSVHYLYSRYRGATLFPWLTSSATLCRWCPSIYSLSSWLCWVVGRVQDEKQTKESARSADKRPPPGYCVAICFYYVALGHMFVLAGCARGARPYVSIMRR